MRITLGVTVVLFDFHWLRALKNLLDLNRHLSSLKPGQALQVKVLIFSSFPWLRRFIPDTVYTCGALQ